ncbi:hypothetical protein K8R43_05320 [archaeon]|nr:hypothetical protein [archaeon]
MNKKVLGTIAFCLVLVSIYLVGSVTRTISDSQDNKETLIRNSNGKYWEPTGENIQAAIDDLENGGTVWVGSDVTLSQAIVPKSDVRIDFQNHKISFSEDVSFLNMIGDGTAGLRRSVIENAYVDPYPGTSKGMILVYIPDKPANENHRWTIRHNTVRNIKIIGGSSDKNFIGIHLKIDGDSSILDNRFEDIFTDWGGTGIKLECNDAGWGNGNIFDNIYINYYKTFIDFEMNVPHASGNGFNYNTFHDCRCQTVSSDSHSYWSEYGVKEISGYGNSFNDCLIWDWYMVDDTHSNHGVHEWWLGSKAYDTKIGVMSFREDYYLDEGHRTVVNKQGVAYPNVYHQSSEPTIPKGSVGYWVDSDDDTYYQILNHDGIQKKMEFS